MAGQGWRLPSEVPSVFLRASEQVGRVVLSYGQALWAVDSSAVVRWQGRASMALPDGVWAPTYRPWTDLMKMGKARVGQFIQQEAMRLMDRLGQTAAVLKRWNTSQQMLQEFRQTNQEGWIKVLGIFEPELEWQMIHKWAGAFGHNEAVRAVVGDYWSGDGRVMVVGIMGECRDQAWCVAGLVRRRMDAFFAGMQSLQEKGEALHQIIERALPVQYTIFSLCPVPLVIAPGNLVAQYSVYRRDQDLSAEPRIHDTMMAGVWFHDEHVDVKWGNGATIAQWAMQLPFYRDEAERALAKRLQGRQCAECGHSLDLLSATAQKFYVGHWHVNTMERSVWTVGDVWGMASELWAADVLLLSIALREEGEAVEERTRKAGMD